MPVVPWRFVCSESLASPKSASRAWRRDRSRRMFEVLMSLWMMPFPCRNATARTTCPRADALMAHGIRGSAELKAPPSIRGMMIILSRPSSERPMISRMCGWRHLHSASSSRKKSRPDPSCSWWKRLTATSPKRGRLPRYTVAMPPRPRIRSSAQLLQAFTTEWYDSSSPRQASSAATMTIGDALEPCDVLPALSKLLDCALPLPSPAGVPSSSSMAGSRASASAGPPPARGGGAVIPNHSRRRCRQ
mmetsp:Transcript_57694/g.162682  ORF Transcript_57694/g.162682 Transcript_57694/m.162682 type:complete len:247 (+) Transcript_57694:563-1303(+)